MSPHLMSTATPSYSPPHFTPPTSPQSVTHPYITSNIYTYLPHKDYVLSEAMYSLSKSISNIENDKSSSYPYLGTKICKTYITPWQRVSADPPGGGGTSEWNSRPRLISNRKNEYSQIVVTWESNSFVNINYHWS